MSDDMISIVNMYYDILSVCRVIPDKLTGFIIEDWVIRI